MVDGTLNRQHKHLGESQQVTSVHGFRLDDRGEIGPAMCRRPGGTAGTYAAPRFKQWSRPKRHHARDASTYGDTRAISG